MAKTKYNIQIEETAIYGFVIEVGEDDVAGADGNIEQAIFNVGERVFIQSPNLDDNFESVPNRAVTWYEKADS